MYTAYIVYISSWWKGKRHTHLQVQEEGSGELQSSQPNLRLQEDHGVNLPDTHVQRAKEELKAWSWQQL